MFWSFNVLWEIISLSVGSLFWGVLIALGCMALFVFIIKGWWKDALFTVWSYLIGAALFVLLAIQCTLIVGSLKVIATIDEYEAQFTEIVDDMYASYEEVTAEGSNEVIQRAIDQLPLLEFYVGSGEFTGYTAKQLPAAIADELTSFMIGYICECLLWCLGFVIVAGVLGIWSLNKRNGATRYDRSPRDRHSSGTHAGRPGTGHRPHISTHRGRR